VTAAPDWWHARPAVESWVPCGSGMHPVRWEDGAFCLPAHPDAEGELVLAALGGDKAGCVELAEAWARHAGDLEVLAIGPRSAADPVTVTWEDVEEFRTGQPGGPHRVQRFPWRPGVGWMTYGAVGTMGGVPGQPHTAPARHPMQDEMDRVRARHLDLLSLLALGPAFQMSLSGAIAAAWSDRGPRGQEQSAHRPALEAALTGRLAPAAADWLGVDPDRVDVRLHEGPGWGRLEVTGSGAGRELRASLPVGWLASVWACGLAVTGGHLVVAVQEAAWPDATVVAVPGPGRAPVVLSVRASDAGPAHWEVSGAGPVPADAPGGKEAHDT
jgi:hypothetical protein